METKKGEELSIEWQYQVALLLKNALGKNGISNDVAENICGDFVFDLAMLHDEKGIDVENVKYKPFLCFCDNDGNSHCSDNDFDLHDYAYGSVSEIFEK